MVQVGTRDVAAVYREVHERLWRSLLAFTGDPDVASDAESEAFTQAMRRGAAVDDIAAWVWRASFRIAAGMLSGRSRERQARHRLVDDPVIEPSVAEFLALLGELSGQQRACVALRYSGGFTPAEIADLLGTSSGTVRVQLHRAHQALRRTLADDPR
jgi:RNA polymerase sigma-70 factor (ECF subfamily)